MTNKKLNLGIFGLGVVGSGLCDALQKSTKLNAEIIKICVKDPNKKRSFGSNIITWNPDEILNNSEINIVVELTDDADFAFEILKQSLSAGKAFITANKKMVSEHFDEIVLLQKEHGIPVLYEGSVCAAIPIIRNLEEYYGTDSLKLFRGIVNGATNYILSETFDRGLSYESALKTAIDKGFAESNPELDLRGIDAGYKLQILLAHAFGVVVKPESITVMGIQNLGNTEINYARKKGQKIKLLACAHINEDNRISAFVAPWFVSTENRFYGIDQSYNAIELETELAENQFYSGRGAGALPTASAILSDISALSDNYRYGYRKLHPKTRFHLHHEVCVSALVRFRGNSSDKYFPFFKKIEEISLNSDEGYIIGEIKLSDLKLLSESPQVSVILNGIIEN